MRILLLASLLLATGLRSELDSLVQAERAFSELSMKSGMRAAFLANLADDSIIFRPGAVKGKPWFENNPPTAGTLSWQPEFADISASGDLGYTTGPYRFERGSGGDSAVSRGYYVTIWRKQPGGAWKVQLDTGIGSAAAPNSVTVTSSSIAGDTQQPATDRDIRAAQAALISAERTYATKVEDYAKAFTADARLYRDDSLPITKAADIKKKLAGQPGTFRWTLADTGISNSADLAYAYGTVEFVGMTYNYVRIWKRPRGGNWRVVLDLLTA
jgi:ketosteroid isomerase-like protein